MYFIFYIFISIIVFAILLYNSVKIVLQPQVENKRKLINVAIYIIANCNIDKYFNCNLFIFYNKR